jgi:type II secretory pathway pseudopilin PulG
MPRGYSLVELLVAVCLSVTVGGVAVALTLSSADSFRAAAAARYVAGRLAQNRMDAVKRSAFVALRFEPFQDGYRLRRYLDRNGNGVRQRDVDREIDVPLEPPVRLEQDFPGVSFGVHPGVPPVTAGDDLDDANPIRIGRSEFLSFSPLGSATAGTVYIRGRGHHQLAVRVLGATGRIRVLRFDVRNRRWTTP